MSRVLAAFALAAMSALASAQPQLKPLSVIVFPGGFNLRCGPPKGRASSKPTGCG